ncbi:uncharacterized protein FIBRA_04793 [Fibroporia radiculosa]|uniref:DUF6534 domain-containing protein n=1 Tax=Fibroporia radiculosa TaxID=599839 RepID=J4HWQ8_9APHY|nr:uncharacterized protein FIBRA_04793 [Fibroporia radiculosa]CCM02687.1 predicted protein [Fibroporia radiculosa]
MSAEMQLFGALFSLDAALGSAYIGTIAAAILYGFNTMQTFIYYRQREDNKTRMGMIFFLWILDTLQLAFIVQAVYTYTISGLEDPMVLAQPVWSLTAHVIITSLSDAIMVLPASLEIERNKFMAASIILTSFATFVAGLSPSGGGSHALSLAHEILIDYVRRFTQPNYYFKLQQLSYFLYVNLGSGAIADTLIATFLCVLLAQCRTGFSRRYGLRNPCAHVIQHQYRIADKHLCYYLLTLATNFEKFGFIAIFFVLPKLLLTSLLASLTARPYLKEKAQPSTTSSATTLRPRLPPLRGIQGNGSILSYPSDRSRIFDSPLASPTEVEIMSMHQLVEEELNRWKAPWQRHQSSMSA